jgi:hypothetical protein
MNIDSNIAFTLITAGAGAYFAIGYIRMKLNERFNNMVRNHEDQITDIYREQEKMWQRVMTLEKCCKTNECKSKQFVQD